MRNFGLRLLLLCSLLSVPSLAHAQFGGEGKPTNDTATIHSVCKRDGTQTVSDDFSGSHYIDHTPTIKYILPIEGARARGEWNEVERLANMSIKVAPNCYYPYFAKAQAQLYYCKIPDAKATLEDFVKRADGKPEYGPLVTVGKNMLDSINSGDAASKCQ
jgi:hypothetical protein